MPTKDELEAELADARSRIAELEDQAATTAEPGTAENTASPKPQRPDYLSAGEKADLEVNGVATSPFTGERLNAIDEGVETLNPTATKRAQQARAVVTERVPNEWPAAGAPPAEGGDSDPDHTSSRV